MGGHKIIDKKYGWYYEMNIEVIGLNSECGENQAQLTICSV